jgi:hypothetical protein
METPSQSDRLAYLDNLRTALVLLVVLHHVALVYGAFAPFYYQEPPFEEPLAFLASGVFVLSNQAWFMGVLFLLAGYFTPSAFDRHGMRKFVNGRLVRLGDPGSRRNSDSRSDCPAGLFPDAVDADRHHHAADLVDVPGIARPWPAVVCGNAANF